MEHQDRFTERAQKVLVLAQDEAKRMNHNYIGTEHVLMGLIRESDGIAGKALALAGVQPNKARSALEFIVGKGKQPFEGDLKLTPRTKHVLELAVQTAREHNHGYIGTEHLLLGLLREGEGIAIGILESLGVDKDRLSNSVLSTIAGSQREGGVPLPETGAGATRENVISVRVGAEDLEAIDALIEAGIRTTRSEAASWLIHAGIQKNLDLFDKVYSTVAEIRRLRTSIRRTAAMGIPSGRVRRPDAEPAPDAAPESAASPETGAEPGAAPPTTGETRAEGDNPPDAAAGTQPPER